MSAKRVVAALSILIATACSALPEFAPGEGAPPAVTPTPTSAATARPTSTPQPTPTEPFIATRLLEAAVALPTPFIAELDGATVFSEGLNVCIVAEGGSAQYLTTVEGLRNVWTTDDGSRVAYVVQPDDFAPAELWLIHSDSSNERLLLTSDDIGGYNTAPYELRWIGEDAPLLMFNTFSPPNGVVADLLHYNYASGELTELLPFGEGGRMMLSPDGKTFALVGPDHISFIDASAENPRVALEFPPLDTGSDDAPLPLTWWAGDSKSVVSVLLVNRPELAAAPERFPEPGAYVFRLPVDGAEPVLVKALPLDERLGWFVAKPGFSPDKQRAGYVTFNDDTGLYEVHIARIFAEGDEVYYTSTERLIFGEWLDDESFTIRVGETSLVEGKLGEVPFRDLLPQPTSTPGPPNPLMPCQPPG